MLIAIASFVRAHAGWLFGIGSVAIVIGSACHWRLRRLRARSRIAEQVEDGLVQNAQGLILSVQGIVNELDPGDRTRQRTEQTLERADQQLSELREKIEDLRSPE
jgi:hypothetical protein